jgi:hypothetical protein
LATGNILTAVALAKVVGIVNTSILVTYNKCFGFTKMDAGEVERIKKAAFGVTVKS